MDDDFFTALDAYDPAELEEFPWAYGVDGGHFIDDYAGDGDFFADFDASLKDCSQERPWHPKLKFRSPARDKQKDLARIPRWLRRISKRDKPGNAKKWPIDGGIIVRPEGYGKSSIIRKLIEFDFKVVFCAKSNDQLEQQQKGFSDLKTERYISKGRNLKLKLATLGVDDFDVSLIDPESPYSSPALNKGATLERLAKLIPNATEVFAAEYENYKAPQLHGLEVDVLMLTISAFQALATSYKTPWWVPLGFQIGTKTIEREDKTIEVPVGHSRVIVVIDDPDYTDFDWLRMVDGDDEAEALYHKRRSQSERKALWSSAEYWMAQGRSELYAKLLADYHSQGSVMHHLQTILDHHYEQRPRRNTLGFGFKRGFGKSASAAPKLLVLTTEHVTSQYAAKTLDAVGLNAGRNVYLPTTKNCHVTTIKTPIVRKANHALLIPIVEQLRVEFPHEDLCFIANGVAAEFNLSNSRGRNDLDDRASLIKLSVPNPVVSSTLRAHYSGTERPRELNALLLSDALNQALGRNQGQRWRGHPAIVLIDPIYYDYVIPNLRYHQTPWSSHEAGKQTLVYHGGITQLEWRFIELLRRAEAFGVSQQALDLVLKLPPERARPFLVWRGIETKKAPQ